MPQENQILRCYSCRRFQVHLIKKTKKWQCKLCNSKQSLKQIFGKGSGKDCRIHAMKLNEDQFMRKEKNYNEDYQLEETENSEKYENSLSETQISKSKWLDFIDVEELGASDKEESEETNLSVQSHVINKRRKTSKENNNTPVGFINNSYKSQNISQRNLEIVNKLDNYVKEVLPCESDENGIEIKDIQKSTYNINKYTKYLPHNDSESKFCKHNSVLHEKQLNKNLKIFEDSVAEEELDEILRL